MNFVNKLDQITEKTNNNLLIIFKIKLEQLIEEKYGIKYAIPYSSRDKKFIEGIFKEFVAKIVNDKKIVLF